MEKLYHFLTVPLILKNEVTTESHWEEIVKSGILKAKKFRFDFKRSFTLPTDNPFDEEFVFLTTDPEFIIRHFKSKFAERLTQQIHTDVRALIFDADKLRYRKDVFFRHADIISCTRYASSRDILEITKSFTNQPLVEYSEVLVHKELMLYPNAIGYLDNGIEKEMNFKPEDEL